ncbi:MAG: phosphatidylglycerophosphatase A [Candidatus Aminicenantales bacterium]
MRALARIFATFFGSGFFPVAPGTFASLIAALLFKFILASWSWPLFAGLIVLIFCLGVPAATAFSKELGQKDPHEIVIDEVCGQWIAYLWSPGTWLPVLIGFFLFRIFDVLKPFPIRRLERLPGGWGIMADDVLAGLYAAFVLHLYLLIK